MSFFSLTYSYDKKRDALDFSKRLSFVREIMLERIYPSRIILPMKQHYGEECVPTVSVGDHVLIGQCVGMPKEGSFAVPVHSGISGDVSEIKEITLPNGITTRAVVIKTDRKRTMHPSVVMPRMDLNISAASVMGIVRDAGIVGMGGEGIPTIAKINRARQAGVTELLVNCMQNEPFAVSDIYRVGESPEYVIMGAVALAGACGAKHISFCIPDTKQSEIEILKSNIDRIKEEYSDYTYDVKVFEDRYPQGYYRLLAKALYNVNLKENETLEDSCKAVLFNCSTLYACWDAIAGNMPLIERVVTVTGDSEEGHNVLAPIGTPVSELLNTINGKSRTENRIVWGSCLTGLIVNNPDDTPIVKTTSAVTVIRKSDKILTNCVHCNKCAINCPMDVNPGISYAAIKKDLFDYADSEGARRCISCGLCSYVCPAGLSLTETVASYAASKREKDSMNMRNRSYRSGKIKMGSVSLLEAYTPENENITVHEDDGLILPFEGGKQV